MSLPLGAGSFNRTCHKKTAGFLRNAERIHPSLRAVPLQLNYSCIAILAASGQSQKPPTTSKRLLAPQGPSALANPLTMLLHSRSCHLHRGSTLRRAGRGKPPPAAAARNSRPLRRRVQAAAAQPPAAAAGSGKVYRLRRARVEDAPAVSQVMAEVSSSSSSSSRQAGGVQQTTALAATTLPSSTQPLRLPLPLLVGPLGAAENKATAGCWCYFAQHHGGQHSSLNPNIHTSCLLPAQMLLTPQHNITAGVWFRQLCRQRHRGQCFYPGAGSSLHSSSQPGGRQQAGRSTSEQGAGLYVCV